MGPNTNVVYLSIALAAVIGGAVVWLAVQRLLRFARAKSRRARDHALRSQAHAGGAAGAASVGDTVPDPCDPDLSERERVDAMRALLLRGDDPRRRTSATASGQGFADTQPQRDETPTTVPMARQPTAPAPLMAEQAERERQPA